MLQVVFVMVSFHGLPPRGQLGRSFPEMRVVIGWEMGSVWAIHDDTQRCGGGSLLPTFRIRCCCYKTHPRDSGADVVLSGLKLKLRGQFFPWRALTKRRGKKNMKPREMQVHM